MKRPALNTENLFDTVRSIINKVRAEGDKAVLEYEATFDKVALSALAVTPEEIQVLRCVEKHIIHMDISLVMTCDKVSCLNKVCRTDRCLTETKM